MPRRLVVAALAALLAGLPLTGSVAAPPPKPGKPGPAEPTPPADPWVPGSHGVAVAEYDGGPTVLTDPEGLTYPGEIRGVTHYPIDGPGPFPLVIYLHGNHATCALAGAELVGYPCPATPATGPVPNYRGYDYLGANLASHGYVTVSIDANAVNTYNVTGDRGANERAQLIARTLDHFRALDAGSTLLTDADLASALAGRIDFDRIGMMGHSRGGEGVSTFITYNETRTDGPRYAIDAVLALAGTDYNLPRTSGVHFGTILPLCDGDVHDLQAAFAYDRHRFDAEAAPFDRVQFTVAGTNHNFYNTVWAGDDYSTSPTAGRCSSAAPDSVRIDAEATRKVGLVLINGFLRRYVGGEQAFAGLMNGSSALPPSACGPSIACDSLVGRSYLPPAAGRRLLVPRADAEATAATTEGAPIATIGPMDVSVCDPRPDGGVDGKNRDAGTASTCASNPYRARARTLTLRADGASALSIDLGSASSIAGFDALTFRAATNFGAPDAEGPVPGALEVALVDRRGRVGTVRVADHSKALVPMASDVARKLTLNGVVVPLRVFAERGVDLGDIDRIELRMTGGPSVDVTELGFQAGVFPEATPCRPKRACG